MDEIIQARNISKKFFLEGKTQYAIKNISFSVFKGQSIAVLGRNGAGKTTLLKLLAGILKPTSGQIIIKGTILSVIDIGGGFHPELSGKENIHFASKLHGVSKSKLSEVYENIIEFSGLDNALDMPVKSYSSGMFLRLAFSCAIFFPCDILLIDEILQVGDYKFQEKSIKRIREIKKSGVNIIHASHNLDGYVDIFEKAMLLNSEYFEFGDFEEILYKYQFPDKGKEIKSDDSSTVLLTSVLVNNKKVNSHLISLYSDKKIKIHLKIICKEEIKDLHASIDISTGKTPLILSSSKFSNENFLIKGANEVQVELDANTLSEGLFSFTIWIGTSLKTYLIKDTLFSIKIVKNQNELNPWDISERNQPIKLPFRWYKSIN